MKTVVVSQRVDFYSDRDEIRDAIDQRLLEILLLSGLMPHLVPNVLVGSNDDSTQNTNLLTWLDTLQPHGVVLSGGNDVGFVENRDNTENKLLDYAELKKLPCLGICRGMQMMGLRAGVRLVKISNHVALRHKLAGRTEDEVNSYHDFALSKCPDGYRIIAKSDDGTIEAIEHTSLPWVGWMWHPEREVPFRLSDIEKIKEIFGS